MLLLGVVWTRLARIGLVVAALSSALLPRLADAQPTLSYREASDRATERAPDVVVATARAASARTEVGVAGMFPNPRITVGTTSGSSMVYGQLYVALPIFGQREASADAADALAQVVAAGVDVTALDARWTAALAWMDLWLVQAELAVKRHVAEPTRPAPSTTPTPTSAPEASRPPDVSRAKKKRGAP